MVDSDLRFIELLWFHEPLEISKYDVQDITSLWRHDGMYKQIPTDDCSLK